MNWLTVVGSVLSIVSMILKEIFTFNSEKKQQRREARKEAEDAVKKNDYNAYLNARAKFQRS